jgi:hypothetical protein
MAIRGEVYAQDPYAGILQIKFGLLQIRMHAGLVSIIGFLAAFGSPREFFRAS